MMAYPPNHCTYQNVVVDIVVSEIDDPSPVEPISLEAAKAWLKMESINDDDAIIAELCISARKWVERYCAVSLLPKSISAILQVNSRIELPYGPVSISTILVNDADGVPINSTCYKIVGLEGGFPRLQGNGEYYLTYDAGYPEIPDSLILAMKEYIAYVYEHRGDQLDENSRSFAPLARKQAFPYKRQLGF